MKNKDIITLVSGGFLSATAHSIPNEHFYKFFRFRREVEKAVRALGDAQAALMRECGIDPAKFHEASGEPLERYGEANNRLLEEDCGVEVKARIPFEFYKGLYDENKTAAGDIFANNAVEVVIIDNLFNTDDNE